jgi:hypothetical protein
VPWGGAARSSCWLVAALRCAMCCWGLLYVRRRYGGKREEKKRKGRKRKERKRKKYGKFLKLENF